MTDWQKLIDQFGPVAVRISWRILGNSADVEDNVQDVFLEACRISERTAVRQWGGLLRRLATFGALAMRRRRRHHVSLAQAESHDVKTPAPEEMAIRRETETKLRDAVAALPEREGATFALRYFEGLALPEIAGCLGISYSAAGTALSRARAKLSEAFDKAIAENKR